MAKNSNSRDREEAMENKETIANEVPGNRYQKDQQIAATNDAIETEGAKSGFTARKTKGKGAELKQQVISDVITGSGNTSGMGVNASGRSVSGTFGGILGASNSTPQADKSRNGSRVGKKLDRTATKLNFTPSEQVLLEVDESKPLADSADQDQGYNGTYRNEFARSQKNSGAVPADLMFQRSVDLICKDLLYPIEGQMVWQTGDDPASYFPSSRVISIDNKGQPITEDTSYHLGNFLHSNFHFGLNDQGKVIYFYADVDDLSVNDATAEDANAASAHRLIKANTAELDRMAMDAAAGDEKADIWTPLARAVNEPTKVSALLSSIEATTGAYVHLAYSKATTNMAYQLNRGPKDGLDEVSPAIEEIVGWRMSKNDSTAIASEFGNVLDQDHIFTTNAYREGDPSLMIAAYDSVTKYHNKADLLLQPRGFRMHLQTADNNMNPLRVPVEYANVFAATECFSTIDHEYDPLMPICMTDKANLISAINLNELCAFCKYEYVDSYFVDFTYDTTNGYAATAKDVKLVDYIWPQRLNWEKLYVSYKMEDSAGYATGAIPEYDSNTGIITLKSQSPFGTDRAKVFFRVSNEPILDEDYVALIDGVDVDDLSHDIVFKEPVVTAGKITKVNDVFKLLEEYGEWKKGGTFVYSYSDLRNNYVVDVKHPLVYGLIEYLNNSIGAKIREKINRVDFVLPLVFSTQYMTLAQLFICAATPWILRVRANSMRDVIYYEDNVKHYPFSKLAPLSSVPFKVYSNFEYNDYDSPLATKVMNPVQAIRWTMPEFFWKVDTGKYVLPWYFNELDLNNDGTVNDDASNMSMPSIRSGVRLGLLDNLYGMTEKDIRLSLDRMTKYLLRDSEIASKGVYKYGRTTDGQILANMSEGKVFSVRKILSCPRELGVVIEAPLGVLTCDPADDVEGVPYYKNLDDDGTATSYRIKCWMNTQSTEHPEILASTGVNINRAANYKQMWRELVANNATSNTDVSGLVFGLGDDTAEFSPFAALGTGAALGNNVSVISYQRSLNTRLQFLPFVISPFDGNHTGTYTHDIYDFAYMFGLCGFRASDYRESVYNREKRAVNEGLLFVSDPWIEDSPIISGAAKGTGLALSKGYELK